MGKIEEKIDHGVHPEMHSTYVLYDPRPFAEGFSFPLQEALWCICRGEQREVTGFHEQTFVG